MNGPEHYLEAERLLQLTDVGSPEQVTRRAQAHAALAQTAATIEVALASLPDRLTLLTDWSFLG